METNKTKQDRLNTVNAIIEEIAKRGRRFFYDEDNNATGHFIMKPNGRIKFVDQYFLRELHIYPRVGDFCPKPRHFSHGGTMWGLVKDMRDFIQKGGYTNHDHGYGGLYCPHWGYPKEDMKAIQDKAIELGYLIEGQVP